MRILLVEDNPGDARLIEEVVAEGGATDIELTHARSLGEAIERAAGGDVDLALLDLSLPDSSGIDTVATMISRAPDVPVVVLTGTGERELALQALERGAQDYLVKGEVDADLLLRSIRYAAQRHRQVEARLAAEREVQRLHEETVQLLASAVDYKRAIERIAELAVPSLADGCAIDALDEDGRLVRAATAYRDPAAAQTARALVHYEGCQEGARGPPRVMSSGEPELTREVTDADLQRIAQNPEHLRLLRELDLRSCMCVPLVARGRPLGAITLVTTGSSDRRFDAERLRRAEELARRAAIAVDNARLYEAANRAVRVRDQFLSIAAHELYTPLTSLQLTVQALRRGILDQSKQAVARASELSERQVKKLAQLIEGLLSVSRIRAGRLELQHESLDLVALVQSVVEHMHHDAARAGCDVVVRAAEPVVGAWDRQRLEQVIRNLLSNAIKFGAGAPVEIEVARRDGVAALTVEDHGIGIARERLPHIFDRFERGVPERAYGGLGLGLFIVREIVFAHRGEVNAQSTVGEGSTFTVTIPLSPPETS